MGGQVLYAFPSLFPRTSTGFRKHIASSNSHFEYANTLPTPCEHLANTLRTPCQLGTSTSSVSPCMAGRWRGGVVPFYFVTCLTAFCSLLLNLLTALFPPFLKSYTNPPPLNDIFTYLCSANSSMLGIEKYRSVI